MYTALPTISTSAFLGFVGGEDQLVALKAAHLEGGRRFLSFFNSPGSYATGRGYVTLGECQVWDSLHHGVSANPSILSSTPTSPKFTAAFSGTNFSVTGPIAQLLLDFSRQKLAHVVGGRLSSPFSVTVVNLDCALDTEEHPRVKIRAPVIIPVVASVASAAGCGIVGDWNSFATILLGMFCNGISSYFLQKGDLTFNRPFSAVGAPAGDGYLEAGNEIIILKGSESVVSTITRGQFSIRYNSQRAYNALNTCGTLLTMQCFAQLLLVPLGRPLGQIFFLISMSVAWLYNVFVARQAKKAWSNMVFEDLLKAPSMERYSLGTRTATAVFLAQVLKPTNIEEHLFKFLPNNTPVWKVWRQAVTRKLRGEMSSFRDTDLSAFDAGERRLLETLFGDAQDAIDAFSTLDVKF